MGRACRTQGDIRNAYRVSIGNLEGNGQLERLLQKQEDNIKMEFRHALYRSGSG
jgi:hypothetical protein